MWHFLILALFLRGLDTQVVLTESSSGCGINACVSWQPFPDDSNGYAVIQYSADCQMSRIKCFAHPEKNCIMVSVEDPSGILGSPEKYNASADFTCQGKSWNSENRNVELVACNFNCTDYPTANIVTTTTVSTSRSASEPFVRRGEVEFTTDSSVCSGKMCSPWGNFAEDPNGIAVVEYTTDCSMSRVKCLPRPNSTCSKIDNLVKYRSDSEAFIVAASGESSSEVEFQCYKTGWFFNDNQLVQETACNFDCGDSAGLSTEQTVEQVKTSTETAKPSSTAVQTAGNPENVAPAANTCPTAQPIHLEDIIKSGNGCNIAIYIVVSDK